VWVWRPSVLICALAIAARAALAIAHDAPDAPFVSSSDDFWGDEDLTPRAGQVDCPDVPLGTVTNSFGTNRWTAVEVRGWNVDCETAVRLTRAHAPQAFDGPLVTQSRGWRCDPGTCRLGRRQVSWAYTYPGLEGPTDTVRSTDGL
jgi:hypothetical protein